MSNAKSQISKNSLTPTDSQKPMSLEEARSVLWLRNDYRFHRPMGELLDEGYLNQDRLKWAAENAYDPRIRQAATVILVSMRQTEPAFLQAVAPKSAVAELPTLEVGMTIEQARTTLWPFRDFKGQPMGVLVDAKQLTLKDLVFAIENAWDERVRRAASVLMAVRLSQAVEEPPSPAGPLKVLSGRGSYAERRQTVLAMIQGMILGGTLIGYAALLLFVVLSATSRLNRTVPLAVQPIVVIAAIVLVLVSAGLTWLVAYLANLFVDRLQGKIEAYRKGQKGEDRVVEAMRQHLDGNWTLFRNVALPGRNKGDVDAVLICPSGVWALEIKTFSGEYRNIGEQWEYRAGRKWKLCKPSPSRQARDNAIRFANFLRAGGIKQWIEPVVVWANRASPLSVNNPSVAVWTLDHLPEQLGNIWQGKTIPESDRARIVEKLTKLCQQPDDAD